MTHHVVMGSKKLFAFLLRIYEPTWSGGAVQGDFGYTCENIIGSFICGCEERVVNCLNKINSYCQWYLLKGGFRISGNNCHDIDECIRSEDNNCHDWADCVNHPGGYECYCTNGWEGDGFDCEQLDLCALEDYCINGDCKNTDNGRVCHCHAGFEVKAGYRTRI